MIAKASYSADHFFHALFTLWIIILYKQSRAGEHHGKCQLTGSVSLRAAARRGVSAQLRMRTAHARAPSLAGRRAAPRTTSLRYWTRCLPCVRRGGTGSYQTNESQQNSRTTLIIVLSTSPSVKIRYIAASTTVYQTFTDKERKKPFFGYFIMAQS